MSDLKDELKKESRKIENQLEKLDKETLTRLAEDEFTALAYIRESILKNDPENLPDEYIHALAGELQIIAKMRLREKFSN